MILAGYWLAARLRDASPSERLAVAADEDRAGKERVGWSGCDGEVKQERQAPVAFHCIDGDVVRRGMIRVARQ